ncbi:hypothetical protein ACFQX7_38040 [Luedemannella flava]
MKRNYDYTLIDSRTGVSDVAEICTIQLPDVLVACFTFSEQSISGAAQVTRQVRQRYEARKIRILPVAMRVDSVDSPRAAAGRLVSMQRFSGMPNDMSEAERHLYWSRMQVPYQPPYAYEEILATFADPPGQPGTLLTAYETLASYVSAGGVTRLAPVDEVTRSRVADLFLRRVSSWDDENSGE